MIGLGAGEPDFDTPDHVKDAAIEAIRAGRPSTRAVDGTPELKEAIAAKFKRENGLDYAAGEITVGTGGKQVIYNALMATLDPGDEVVDPGALLGVLPGHGAARRRHAGVRPLPRADRLQAAARGSRGGDHAADQMADPELARTTRPGPPTPTAELRALTDVLLRHPQVWVLTDDMYEHLVYDGLPLRTHRRRSSRGSGRARLTMNGVSKAYAMTGWRIGYARRARRS